MDLLSDATVSGVIGAIVGALGGALIGTYLTNRSQRVSRAFDFHREFNTVEMGRHRGIAEQLIKKYPTADFEELGRLDYDKVDSLYLIMRFYQRLWLAIKYNQVHPDIVRDMFDNNFYYWHYTSFEKCLVELDWSATPHIKALAHWFYQEESADRHVTLRDKYLQKRAEWMQEAGDRRNAPHDSLPTE